MQRQATKMILALKNMSYEKRLCKVDLPSLYYHSERADMVEVKMTHGHYGMQTILNFDGRSGLCGHSLKLKKDLQGLQLGSISLLRDW